MQWRMADARKRFGELVTKALTDGPQRVLRHNEAVVVISEQDYERLSGKRLGFKEFLMGAGPTLDDLDLTRDRSLMRDANP